MRTPAERAALQRLLIRLKAKRARASTLSPDDCAATQLAASVAIDPERPGALEWRSPLPGMRPIPPPEPLSLDELLDDRHQRRRR